MEFRLAQCDHFGPWVRAWGISPTDPYVEICWATAGKPRAALLTSCAARLTEPDSERIIGAGDLWESLGEDPANEALMNEMLIRAGVDCNIQQLGDYSKRSADGPGRRGDLWTFAVKKTVPLVPPQHLDRLHDVELAHHVATVHNINERLGPDHRYVVELPGWVYWRAGMEGTDADLADVRDALFNRGLPDWPSLQIDEAGSARGLVPPVGPSGGPEARLAVPGWDDRDTERPLHARRPQHAGGAGVETATAQPYYSRSTGECLVYLGDHMWSIAADPPAAPATERGCEVNHAKGEPDDSQISRPLQGSATPAGPSKEPSSQSEPDPATDVAQRRFDGLSRRDPTSPGLGL